MKFLKIIELELNWNGEISEKFRIFGKILYSSNLRKIFSKILEMCIGWELNCIEKVVLVSVILFRLTSF